MPHSGKLENLFIMLTTCEKKALRVLNLKELYGNRNIEVGGAVFFVWNNKFGSEKNGKLCPWKASKDPAKIENLFLIFSEIYARETQDAREKKCEIMPL